jgi:hypothetical protein
MERLNGPTSKFYASVSILEDAVEVNSFPAGIRINVCKRESFLQLAQALAKHGDLPLILRFRQWAFILWNQFVFVHLLEGRRNE